MMVKSFRKFVSSALFFLSSSVISLSLVAQANNVGEDVKNYQLQRSELEQTEGPFGSALIEPLTGLVSAYQKDRNYLSALEEQRRLIQIFRTEYGFSDPNLIPLLRTQLEIELALGGTESVSDIFDHMRFVQSSAGDETPEELLSIIDEQAYWSLLRIFFDRSREGVKQFFVARELIEQQIDLAEKSFGEADERSIPWSYRKAVNNLRLVQLLNVSNGLSYETIDRLFREDGALALQDRDAPFFYGRERGSITPTVKQGSMLGQRYLEKSYRLVKDIDEILEQKAAMLKAAESPKYLQALETQAMAKIARGDFQQLLGRSTAIRDYREAKELLVDAGVEKKLIEHFFSVPEPLPSLNLYSSLQGALSAREGSDENDGDRLFLGTFTGWADNIGFSPMPVAPSSFPDIALEYGEFDVNLSISRRGRASSVKISGGNELPGRLRNQAVRAVRKIPFRPAIVDGKTKRVITASLIYKIPLEIEL